MRVVSPAFGLISGVGTTLGLLPHILVLCILLIAGIAPRSVPVTSLIVFTIGAKLLGEWIFWNHARRRMDSEAHLKHWRSAVNQSLLSQPNVFVSFFMMCVDLLADAMLISIALKTSLPPIWSFLALLGCQALSSPIQGFLSDYFSQKKSLMLASFIGMATLMLSIGIPLDTYQEAPTDLLASTTALKMVLILCGKGLFGNLIVIARAAIAEVIKVDTLEQVREM